MVSKISGPMTNGINVMAEKQINSSFREKSNHGKLPKKIHKAEREKMKRDHLNELFLELANALEQTRQNNGKASILDDATRLLHHLLTEVKCLRTENVALLSESHYMTVEKNELRDENAVLESQIEKLQTQLQGRTPGDLGWNTATSQLQHTNSSSQFSDNQLTSSIVEPALQSPTVLVIPLHHDAQSCPELQTVLASSKIPSNVSRPHARYPTPLDSWPSQLLVRKPDTTEEDQHKSNSSSCSSTSRDDEHS